jgi:hypothetical protein
MARMKLLADAIIVLLEENTGLGEWPLRILQYFGDNNIDTKAPWRDAGSLYPYSFAHPTSLQYAI